MDRPTFDESWYRVVALHPRLHPVVQTYRQEYRGKLWHVIHDPASNQFFRVSEAAYHFLGLLDGRRTVADAWRLACDRLGDDAPTQGEVIQLLGQLYTANLLHGDLPADAAGMFERYRRRRRREVGGYLMNLLFLRIPLFDPDRLLDRWTPVMGWMFGPVGMLLWLVILALGFHHLAGRWGELFAAADPQSMLALENLVLLYLCFAGIKALHELGHGFACKRFGRLNRSSGEVHTIGIMLLVLMPVPYVDASSAWAFRNKWHRAFVGAAGMYVELAVASMAAIVWARTAEGALAHDIAYNLIFVAGVSTLLFNGNPLLRYDGYYILSDLLGIPNLAQRSKQYIQHLVKHYGFGVTRSQNPAHSAGERWWLLSYGITASIYRVFIFAAIILYVADELFFIGTLMALAGVISFVCVPIGKFARYLATSPELNRVRPRASYVTFGFLLLVFIAVGIIPWPDYQRAEGVITPAQRHVVHALEAGVVTTLAPTGGRVQQDQTVLIGAQDVDLQYELRSLLAGRRQAEAESRQAQTRDPAEARIIHERLDVIHRQIARVQQRLNALQQHSPMNGLWIAPDIDRLEHAYVQRGQEIGAVVSMDELIVRIAADQHLGPRIAAELADRHDAVEMRPRGRPDVQFTGAIIRAVPAGQRQLPSPALAMPAGGSMPVDLAGNDPSRSAEPFFQIDIQPNHPQQMLLPGQRIVVRFELSAKPLAMQWWLSLRQLLQQRFSI